MERADQPRVGATCSEVQVSPTAERGDQPAEQVACSAERAGHLVVRVSYYEVGITRSAVRSWSTTERMGLPAVWVARSAEQVDGTGRWRAYTATRNGRRGVCAARRAIRRAISRACS